MIISIVSFHFLVVHTMVSVLALTNVAVEECFSFVNQLLIEQRPLCGRRLSTEEASPACHFILRLMWLSPVAKSAVDSLHGDPMIRRGNVLSVVAILGLITGNWAWVLIVFCHFLLRRFMPPFLVNCHFFCSFSDHVSSVLLDRSIDCKTFMIFAVVSSWSI